MADNETVARPSRPRLNGLVRNYILEHFEQHPDDTVEQATVAVKETIKMDYAGASSVWVFIMLQMVDKLLPLILSILKS